VIRYHGDGYLTAGNLRLAILRALFRGEGCPIPPYTNQTIAQDDPAGETHYTWTATSVVPSTIPDAGVAAKTVPSVLLARSTDIQLPSTVDSGPACRVRRWVGRWIALDRSSAGEDLRQLGDPITLIVCGDGAVLRCRLGALLSR